jgi:hypothetical protein
MSIHWQHGDTADPEKLLITAILRLRTWWRRRRADAIEAQYGGARLHALRRLVGQPAIRTTTAQVSASNFSGTTRLSMKGTHEA